MKALILVNFYEPLSAIKNRIIKVNKILIEKFENIYDCPDFEQNYH